MTVSETAAAIEGAAGSIQQTAAQIIALAKSLVEDPPPPPPVIVVKRRSVLPDEMPGRNDTEKLVAAAQEAIERDKPLEFDRMYVSETFRLDERYDLITMIGRGAGTGVVEPDVPTVKQQTWGWQLHLAPASGKRLRVKLRNFELNGNRDRAAQHFNTTMADSHTQHGIVLDGYYEKQPHGVVELDAVDVITHSHDFSGCVSMSDGNRYNLVRLLSWGNGQSGVDFTRGRGALTDCVSRENGGVQFNLSNSPFSHLIGCKALNGGRGAGRPHVGGKLNGGGVKISARPWVGDVSVPVHAQFDGLLIEGCVGVGLSATSAPPGSRITGTRLVIRGGCSSAINLTQLPDVRLEVQEIVCEDGWQPLYDDVAAPIELQNDADVLVFGGPIMAVERLTIQRSRRRGLVGGWGSKLMAELGVEVRDCAGQGIEWKGEPGDGTVFEVPKVLSMDNGAPDLILEA